MKNWRPLLYQSFGPDTRQPVHWSFENEGHPNTSIRVVPLIGPSRPKRRTTPFLDRGPFFIFTMNSEQLIKQLKADLNRIHKEIQRCLGDLDSKIDHLIELHGEYRRSRVGACRASQVYNGGDEE